MSQECDNYIKEQMDIDYVCKSKNSAIAFIFVTLLFLFLQRFQAHYRVYIFILAALVFISALLRLFNFLAYNVQKRALKDAVRSVTLLASLNCVLWCAIGVLSVLEYSDHSFQLLVTFIILISISASSVVTISHKRYAFLFMSTMVILPQIFYSFMEYVRTDDPNILWLFGYSLINIGYNIRQANVIQQDLTTRFITEFELKKSLEQVAASKRSLEEETIKTFHASRLSSLGEMAGSIAHEINNPLTIIQSLAKSVLERSKGLEETEKTKLYKVVMAGERIAKIVRGMKIISSKNDHIEHEKIKVSKIIDLSLGLFEERIKNENIHLVELNETDPTLFCNSLQISQILINLISNALDALQKYEGKPEIRIEVREDFNRQIAEIRVINSGTPLTKEIEQKIFEPFFSTKSLGKGTGLGLSISQTLAQSNGGTLSYEEYHGQISFKLVLKTQNE